MYTDNAEIPVASEVHLVSPLGSNVFAILFFFSMIVQQFVTQAR